MGGLCLTGAPTELSPEMKATLGTETAGAYVCDHASGKTS